MFFRKKTIFNAETHKFSIIRAMKRVFSSIRSTLCALVLATPLFATTAETSPWRFGAGVSVGNLTPVMLEGSVGYKAASLHVAGFGVHKGANDFWCGMRGGFGWRIPRDLPFSLEFGIGGGYQFAAAPNGMHKAVNDANDARYLYPYNFIESLDVSGEIRIQVFGLFSQLSFPVYNFMDHDAPNMLWRVGYMAEF